MYARVIGGLAAWSFGAVMATALSLFAISAVGEGLSADPVRTLTSDDVARALAAASASPSAPAPAALPSASASPDGVPAQRRPAAAPGSTSPASAPAHATDRGAAVGSPGGTALAVCTASGAYLTSWSPAQGYSVKDVSRGPAPVASVVFTESNSAVRLQVSCASGVPTAQVSGVPDDNHSPDQHDY